MSTLKQLRTTPRGPAGVFRVVLTVLFSLLLPLQQAAGWYHLGAEHHEWSGHAHFHGDGAPHAHSHQHVARGHEHSADHEHSDVHEHPDHSDHSHYGDHHHNGLEHEDASSEDTPGAHPEAAVPDHDHHAEDHLEQDSLRLPPTVKLTVHLVALALEAPFLSPADVQEVSRFTDENDREATGPPRGAPPPLRAPPIA